MSTEEIRQAEENDRLDWLADAEARVLAEFPAEPESDVLELARLRIAIGRLAVSGQDEALGAAWADYDRLILQASRIRRGRLSTG